MKKLLLILTLFAVLLLSLVGCSGESLVENEAITGDVSDITVEAISEEVVSEDESSIYRTVPEPFAPYTIESPANPLIGADFDGCSVYVTHNFYGYDEPTLLDKEQTASIVELIQEMEIDELPSVVWSVVPDGDYWGDEYILVLSSGTKYALGSGSASLPDEYGGDVSFLIIDGYYYVTQSNVYAFEEVWRETYIHDEIVSKICYNEYKFNIVCSIAEWEYERNIQNIVEAYSSVESEEDYYEILFDIDDVTKYVASVS